VPYSGFEECFNQEQLWAAAEEQEQYTELPHSCSESSNNNGGINNNSTRHPLHPPDSSLRVGSHEFESLLRFRSRLVHQGDLLTMKLLRDRFRATQTSCACGRQGVYRERERHQGSKIINGTHSTLF
jgi:hypothetical protein